MALDTLQGSIGYKAFRVSSMDGRAIGKLTSANHLGTLHMDKPAKYDRIISLFTQTELFSNDLQQMLDNTDTYWLEGNSDLFTTEIGIPYQYPKVIAIPESTSGASNVGIDEQPFELILDTDEYRKNDVVTFHRQHAPDFSVVSDPEPAMGGFLYKFTLNTNTPQTDYVDADWLTVGRELLDVNQSMGEFDTDFGGLGKLGGSMTMFHTMSSEYGFSHKITDWADARELTNFDGKPLDIQVYAQYRRNALGKDEVLNYRWEALIDSQLRKKMMSTNVKRKIWSKGGTQRTNGSKQEIKRLPMGIYHQILEHGHVLEYNRGEFNIPMLRDLFGDLFRGRVAMKDRRVKMYTNEAGILAFNKANKEDLMGSGLTVIADQRFIEGTGRHMMVSYNFEAMTSTETGRVDVIHLTELDHPEVNSEFGQNQYTAPLFLVFDVTSDGGKLKNVREVRRKSRPSMRWGYVDGAVHHLGFAASQGMSSANTNPWYELWMKDRNDVIVEDPSRCILIQEKPLF